MKKGHSFSARRIPAFFMYALAAVCFVGGFTKGMYCMFMASFYYILGACIDPEGKL